MKKRDLKIKAAGLRDENRALEAENASLRGRLEGLQFVYQKNSELITKIQELMLKVAKLEVEAQSE